MGEQDIDNYGERRLQRAIDELAQEFHGIWSRETIDRFVHECHDQLDEQGRERGGMLNFAGLHAGRFARERLWALAQAEGHVEKTKPEVLYVCVRNAGRSQMAAALTHHLSKGWIGVRSAGSAPGERIDDTVAEAMLELGVDVYQEFPKPLTDEVVRAADAVVTMGCGDACPVYPGKHYEDWEVADPEGQPLHVVRAIRDDLRERVGDLIEQLTTGRSTSTCSRTSPTDSTSASPPPRSRARSSSGTRTSRGCTSTPVCCSSTAARPASPRTAIRAARSRSSARAPTPPRSRSSASPTTRRPSLTRSLPPGCRRSSPPSSSPQRERGDAMKYVLFVCNHDAGRSQMAQAFFERLAPPDVRAESAGSNPAPQVWPEVIEAMAEVGLDLSGRKPKKLLREMQLHADWAVTMGCGDACPYVPTMVEAWDITDPAGRDLGEVRAIRDAIEAHVRALVVDRLDAIRSDRTAHQLRLAKLIPQLAAEFEQRRTPDQIRACADAVLASYDDAPVRSHVFTLAHRQTRACLRREHCDVLIIS